MGERGLELLPPFVFLEQDAEKVRQLVLFIWSVWSVWFVWLHETNQMDQKDQTNRQTGLVLDMQLIETLLAPKWLFAVCYTSSRPAERTFFQEVVPRKVSNSRVVPGNVVFVSRSRG